MARPWLRDLLKRSLQVQNLDEIVAGASGGAGVAARPAARLAAVVVEVRGAIAGVA